MSPRYLALLTLPLCYLGGSDAFGLPGTAWFAGVVVDNAKEAGVPLPGYLELLSSKSNVLTYLIHYIFGNKLEERFERVIKRELLLLPESAPIEDVNEDNEEKMTFKNGMMMGLKSIRVTPNTAANIIWSATGVPVLTIAVNFEDLRIKGDIKTKFSRLITINVEGKCDLKFVKNNFVLKFHLYPGLFEWCYLKLYDVVCTDLDEVNWDVKDMRGKDDKVAEMAMQSYFLNYEGVVENHIKTSIANVIYRDIPLASPAICDNTKNLRDSTYQKFKRRQKKISAGKHNVVTEQSAEKNTADTERKSTKGD